MTAPTPPDYSAWKYRAIIRITNPVATAAFQHKLTLAWRPGMRRDFRDIRFTQQNGTNCPYWIESKTNGSTATVWIKVPSANQRLLHLYYGNGAAVSASSGTNTFTFFDHFDGDLATNWTTVAGTPAIGSSLMTINGTDEAIKSKTQFAANTVIEFYGSITNNYTGLFGYYDPTANKRAIIYSNYGSNGYWNQNHDGANSHLTSMGNFSTAMSRGTIKRNSTTSVIYNWGSLSPVTDTTYVPTGSINIGAYTGVSATVIIDWIAVRVFSATEPTLTVSITGLNPLITSGVSKHLAGITLTAGTEYTFDPVNVDHGMVVAAGGQEVDAAAANVAASMVVAAAGQDVESGAINIYHPMYPTASWAQIIDPVVDSGYLIGVTVSQSMDDAMAEAVFEYDGNEIGNYFSGDYMTKIHVNIPDYLGVSNCVFVGLIPSSKAVYDVARDKMTMRAVDYGLFLSKQTLDIKDLSLLPPDDQTTTGANVAKVLSCDGLQHLFQIGQTITGMFGMATGTIYEVVQITNGVRLTLYPATGTFQDDEEICVGGVTYGYADGRSLDIPYTPYYEEVMPEDWVKSILGGDNWMRVTGIEPYYLESSSGYWDTEDCPAVPFMFGSLEKKRDALKRVAAYMDYLWHVKPRSIGTGSYSQAGYFIKQTSIDTLLNLPAAATITGPDDFVGEITLDQDGEMQVDVVRVRCQDLKGNWLEQARSNSYYDAGEGPFREFADEPKDICTEVDLSAYATDMYNLYSARTCSWSATLAARSDLQLYQLLNISGMGIEAPAGTYRIVKISHEYGCAKNLTHITFMLSTSFSILRKYGMTYKDSISKVQQIAEGLENRKLQPELATITATDGWTLTFTTEAGNKGQGRDSTSTPALAGSIPVGAKVSVQNTRGGIVCIPINGSGDGTSLLVVGVPTIIRCEVDSTDANYWYLGWTPGTNNQNVSANFQTTGYPSAAGVVLPYGNPASCGTRLIPKNYTQTRIRFSGPNTTYYVKLWGEKNGVYSATGAQATITSGATVTPIDTPYEMEPIGVIDELLCSGVALGPSDGPVPYLIELYAGMLSFTWNGIDNIYIGGPATLQSGWPATGWVSRYMNIDDELVITGPGGTITVPRVEGWRTPVLISGILVAGSNTLTVSLRDKYYGTRGCTDLWIRTYYL
jgi:hypothetical protein